MASKQKAPIDYNTLPILPVRDTVLFPNAILPLTVGRDSSLKLINDLKEEEKYVGVISQRDPRVDNPQPVDLFQIGTVAFVHKIIKLPSQLRPWKFLVRLSNQIFETQNVKNPNKGASLLPLDHRTYPLLADTERALEIAVSHQNGLYLCSSPC